MENRNNIRSTQNFIEFIVLHIKKGKKVPIHLQLKVKFELEKLLNEGHIENLTKTLTLTLTNQFFISSIVIIVKKIQSINIALDSKILNKAVHKNKYEMPNIDSLIQAISQTLSYTPQETAYFTTLDLQYAYSQ